MPYRTQSGQQASYGGRPPLGRAPATPPQAWDPWYPLARQRLPFSAAPCADTSSPSLTTRQTSSTRPPPAPASQAEPVPHANLCTSVIDRLSSAPGDNGSRGSKSQGGRLTGSQGQSTRSSLPAPSPPAAWLHSQSAQQLTANVKQLAAQVSPFCFACYKSCMKRRLRFTQICCFLDAPSMPCPHAVKAMHPSDLELHAASCMCYRGNVWTYARRNNGGAESWSLLQLCIHNRGAD